MSQAVRSPWAIVASFLPALVLSACGGDDPQVPTTITPPAVSTVSGVAGAAVSPVPTVTVRDQKGKTLANVWVKWAPSSGTVLNDSALTDAAGVATAGGWILGIKAGPQTLVASTAGVNPTTFRADAKPGSVAILLVTTRPPSGMVTTMVPTPPSVRATDENSNPVAGVTVSFAVAIGGGSITGPLQVTDANGVATVGSWKLGTLAGTQTLRADVFATGASTFIPATATSAAATQMVLLSVGAATGSTGKRLCTSPRVSIRDVYGNGVGNIPVTFTPVAGSGSVSGGTVVSDDDTGLATVSAWTLGTSETQTLVATSSALPGVRLTFTAALVPAASFSICARLIGDAATPRQREAVDRAIARWQRVIVGHSQTTGLVNIPAGACDDGVPNVDIVREDIEDLLLYVKIAPIDGVKGIIAQAGPCAAHANGLTMVGTMTFDQADLELTVTSGTIDNVVLHEIGHILGIGTLWNYKRSLLFGRGSDDPYFTGATAREEFARIFGGFTGNPVPVENCVDAPPGCGTGTRDGHWRKSVFGTELMQGYVNPSMRMSRVTVGSLADLGYIVDLDAADIFPGAVALRAGDSMPGLHMANDIADTPLYGFDRRGNRELLRPARNPFRQR